MLQNKHEWKQNCEGLGCCWINYYTELCRWNPPPCPVLLFSVNVNLASFLYWTQEQADQPDCTSARAGLVRGANSFANRLNLSVLSKIPPDFQV